MKRRVYTNLAVFSVLFSAMVFWAVRSIVSVGVIDHPYALSARFTNAVGVLPNSEVTYLGVSYGAVRRVVRIPGGVEIHMDIKNRHLIPQGSTASIFRKSAIGEQYIDFEPPAGYHGPGGPYYPPGTVLNTDKTTVPLEFSELLRSANALLSSISPDDVATLLHEAATGLQGRSDSLRQMTESGDRLSATLAQKTAALNQLLTTNTRLTHTVAVHREALGQALSDLDQVAQALRQSKGDLTTLLDQGPAFLGDTANLVAGQKANLDCSLKVLERVTDATTTPDQLAALRAFLDFGPPAFGGAFDSRDIEPDGIWIRVGMVSNPSNPPVQYVPPHTLPAVRAGSACTSPLTPYAVADYRPAATASTSTMAPMAAHLPATARHLGLGAVVSLIAAAFILRRVTTVGLFAARQHHRAPSQPKEIPS